MESALLTIFQLPAVAPGGSMRIVAAVPDDAALDRLSLFTSGAAS